LATDAAAYGRAREGLLVFTTLKRRSVTRGEARKLRICISV